MQFLIIHTIPILKTINFQTNVDSETPINCIERTLHFTQYKGMLLRLQAMLFSRVKYYLMVEM